MSAAARLFHGARSGDWFDRERALGYGTILLVVEIVTFIFFAAGTYGLIVPLPKPTSTDFVSFYAAGALADAGTPQFAYVQAQHFLAEQHATVPGIGYSLFFYPPVYLMLCAVVARLPYLVAFVVFEVATLIPFLLVARRIVDEPGWRIFVPLAAFPAVLWTIGVGQNAFITAALFGGATLLIDRRPILAGCLFGALCYKPHFGLLVPVALAAGGHWRAFLAAAATVAGLVLASLLVFGWPTWADYLALAATSTSTYADGRVTFAGFISPFGGLRLLGVGVAASYTWQAAIGLAAALFVGLVWRRGLSLPLRAAALIAATPVAVPVILFYDFTMTGIALAWLVRSARQDGFFAWEKAALLFLFLVPMFTRFAADNWHVPLGPLGSLGALALVVAAVWRAAARRGAGAGAAPLSLPA